MENDVVAADADDTRQLDVREGGVAAHPRVHPRPMAGSVVVQELLGGSPSWPRSGQCRQQRSR
eukprot:211631-Alexandrium_andersonii.AAC.1